MLDPDVIRAALPAGAVIGSTVQVFAEVDSTNDVAARAGRLGANEGLVVFAESQRAGRGRQGRRWSSAPGLGLWFSVLLRPRGTGPLALLAAAAVAGAVEGTVNRPAGVKWPNDVLLDGRKVAGVLIEATGDFAVVGIGVNANQGEADFPPEIRGGAGSLAMVASGGTIVDRAVLAGKLLSELDARYRDWPSNAAEIVAECQVRNTLRARRVRTADGVVGNVVGIAPDGGLRLRVGADDGERVIYAGEVLPL